MIVALIWDRWKWDTLEVIDIIKGQRSSAEAADDLIVSCIAANISHEWDDGVMLFDPFSHHLTWRY